MTLAETARRAADQLRAAGFPADEAARETGVLARAWLGWDQARWLTDAAAPASAAFVAGLDAWAARRAAREPSAYITGRREFYGRDYRVSPAVLIPRPESETLIEAGLQALARLRPPAEATTPTGAPLVLDIGTGSGCLAVTLALERPDVTVVATDVSADALAVAADNLRNHGVTTRVSLQHVPLAGGARQRYDLIVANPPYVPERDRDALAPDVRDFEPAVALFGGADGLDVIRELVPAARAALRPSGTLVCEIGHDQADAVAAIVEASELRLTALEHDLAGIPRVVVAQAAPV